MERPDESVLDVRNPDPFADSLIGRVAHAVRLEDVLITQELAGRSMRPRNYVVENRALFELAEELSLRPENLLGKLAEIILALCDAAGSAGVSILEPEVAGASRQFRFKAVAGRCASLVDRLYACDDSPCGAALEKGETLLFDRPGRRFLDLASFDRPIYECLVSPILFDGKPIGTLWGMSHAPERRFDAEDARLLESLSRFAAAGYRTTTSLREATAARDESQARVEELARAHGALRESERRLALIADAVPTLICSVDRSLVYTFCNRAYAEFLELPERKIVGRRVRDILGAEPFEAIRPRLELALAGESVNFEETVRLSRREPRYLVSSYIPERDESGDVVGLYSAASDFTDRRRAEERLLASERNFRAIFELAGSGKAQADPTDCRFTRVNRKFCEITGYHERELLRMTWSDLTHPEDRAGDGPIVQAVLRGERPSWTREKRYVRKDGKIVWVMISGSVIRDSAGKPSSLIATIADVTSRRLAENAVRESEARYRAIVESQTEMICRFRLSGEILFVNGAYARARGTTPEALRSANFWSFIAEEDRAAVRAMLETLTPETPEARVENRFRAVDGERWTLWTNRALSFDDEGSAAEFQSTGIDVTELRTAQEALQLADKRKDEFLAMLGHELRNPLAPIRSGLELLEIEGGNAAERRETISVMSGQVDHLVRLVDDLLDVSRIVRGRIELQRGPVDLRDVLKRAREVVEGDVREREQSLKADLPRKPLWTDGDPVRLAQVFENLLVNASKYNLRKGRIELSARREGNEHVVCVRDTGIGIDPELLPTIFELFTQSRRSLDRAQGGLGLGLALVQNLVRLHGGTVSVRSEGRDKGSEFAVRLPAIEEPTMPEAEPTPPATSRGKRALLVDDNSAALFLLKRLIAKLGAHEIATAPDGPSALAEARAFRPEIALLDIGLPGMDGYEVARRMRADPDLAGIKLVALTGYGQDEDRRCAEEAGFDRHLVKPVSIDDLRALLAE